MTRLLSPPLSATRLSTLLYPPRDRRALTLSSHPVAVQHADNEGMDAISRPLLTLICPACGATFPSAMQMDPRIFEGIRTADLFERCPKCSRVSRFNKPDYLFRSDG
jgi:hypothetical protein